MNFKLASALVLSSIAGLKLYSRYKAHKAREAYLAALNADPMDSVAVLEAGRLWALYDHGVVTQADESSFLNDLWARHHNGQ